MQKTILNKQTIGNPFHKGLIFSFGFVFGFVFSILLVFVPNQNDASENLIHHGTLHFDQELFKTIDKRIMKHLENGSLAQKLYKEVRVLCWVMTHPGNHKAKAIHVQKTWGKRCNKLIFMSSKNDSEINAIALPVGEGRDNLWAKTKEAFKYVYQNHFNDADWFMKADDDTYVFVENLRYLLYPYSPYQQIYFGSKFSPFVKQGYMSGGAGYVLSKETLRIFVEKGLPDSKICRPDAGGYEDVEIGTCMEKLNVTVGDTRDNYGREKFFPFKPDEHLITNGLGGKKGYFSNKVTDGLNCCSTYPILFHYVTPSQMYVLEYLAYYFKIFGSASLDELPLKHAPDELESDQLNLSEILNSSTIMP